MILFKKSHGQFFNLLIHNLLNLEIYNGKVDIDDMVEIIVPKYLCREKFLESKKVLQELYEWSSDDYNHELNPFHQLVLYKFIEYIDNKQEVDNKFRIKLRKVVDGTIDVSFTNKRKPEINFYNMEWYLDNIFENKRFLFMEKFEDKTELKNYLLSNTNIVKSYYEILPFEIQQLFKNEESISDAIEAFLSFVNLCLKEANLSLMFWTEGKPMSEKQIQVVLENLLDYYFYSQDIDITREALIGSGNIDFRFYRNKNEKILFEVKKASSSHLKSGYEKQLISYMKSEKCTYAFYLIICFNDIEYTKAKKFMENHEETDIFHKDINIFILDVRVKNQTFNSTNMLKLDNSISVEIDSYFRDINKFLSFTTAKGILEYLKDLKANCSKIENIESRELYLKKFQEIRSRYLRKLAVKLLWSDEFYEIIEPNNSPRLFAISSIETVSEKAFYHSIDEIINFYENISDKMTADRISEEKIKEIFQFLKEEYYEFYKIMKSLTLKIYLFDNSHYESDSDVVPTSDVMEYSLVCFYMRDGEDYDNGTVNSTYLFFYQLGAVLFWVAEENCLELLQLFAEILNKNYEDYQNKNNEFQMVFAGSFAGYIMYNTVYNKYNPYIKIAESFYEIWDLYYKKLFSELNLKL